MKKRTEKKKNKKQWLNGVWIILLIVGLLLIFSGPIKNWMISNGSQSLTVDSIDANTIEENHQKDADFEFDEVQMLDLETAALAQFNSDQINVLGGISIPSVELNLPIGKGTSSYTLALTAGTMKEEQVMGEGNYALAGHYMERSDLLFKPLYRVELGDAVYLTDLSFIYEYEVAEQRMIEATEVSVLDDVSGETTLTLITCDENGAARLLTVADFVQKVPVEEASAEMIAAFDLDLSIRSR